VILCSEQSTGMPLQEKLSVPLNPELQDSQSAIFDDTLSSPQPWPLTFWPQNLISSSLSPIVPYCKFVEVPKVSKILWSQTDAQTHKQTHW